VTWVTITIGPVVTSITRETFLEVEELFIPFHTKEKRSSKATGLMPFDPYILRFRRLRRRAQTEVAESVPNIGFQVGKWAVASHARAVAIDNTDVCQKPLFASFGVSSDFFELRIEIGMRGDGKICQRKRKPVTGGLQNSFLARPASKEARHAEMVRQRLKPGAFAKREESLGQ